MDFRLVQQLLLRAREVPPAQRQSWLERECAGDEALRQEVLSLLAHETDEPRILSPGVAAQALARSLGSAEIPDQVGPFRLLERLGEGGMGVVYRAQQQEPLRREVAVKFLRFGALSAGARARFDVERAVLARMEHPGIARVFDAGADSQGRPWVAMELVEGQPITRWCDEQRATLTQRITLLRDVCRAIQHAHQKGVLHRDLKPSNILVDQHEGQPRARVIDFGIAKGLDDSLGGAPMTLAGELVGTPEYMSPEQAGADAGAVDTRSDVYSLGVVLYELLVGDTPIGRKTMQSRSLAEVLVLLRERAPEAPSRRFRSLPAPEQQAVAEARAIHPDALRRAVRGDLDAVVLRALEHTPDRRYASAAAMADELDRWLRREPVEAALPGPRRRLAATARRHRVGFAVLVTGMAVLLAGATTTLWQAARAQRQRAVAEQRLEDIRTFVIDLIFRLDSRLEDLSGAAETRRYLAAQTIEQLARIGQEPQARARLRVPLASGYRRLSFLQLNLGDLAAADSSSQAGIRLLEEGLQSQRDLPGARRELAILCNARASLHDQRGDRATALADEQRSLEQFERLTALDPGAVQLKRDLCEAQSNVARRLLSVGRAEEGMRLRQLAIDGRRELVREHPDILDDVSDLGNDLRRQAEYWSDAGRLDLAREHYREALGFLRRVYEARPDNLDYKTEFGAALQSLGYTLLSREGSEEGFEVLHEARRTREELVAANPGQLRYVNSLGWTLCTLADAEMDRGRPASALPLCQRADSLTSAALAASPDNVALLVNLSWAKQTIGRAHTQLGSFATAEAALHAALGLLADVPVDTHDRAQWRMASVEGAIGRLFVQRSEQGAVGRTPSYWEEALRWHDQGLTRMHALRARGALVGWQLAELDRLEQSRAVADSSARAKRGEN